MINLLTYLLNPMIGLFDASIAVDAMMAAVPATALNAFMMAGISLIPLSFGMRKNRCLPRLLRQSLLVS